MKSPESILPFSQPLVKNNSPEVNFDKYGFNQQWEIDRRNNLVKRFGYNGLLISQHEHDRMVEAYDREFIYDVPFSRANVSWFDGQNMYILPYKDSLFKPNINPKERDGATSDGWQKLEQVIGESMIKIKNSGMENEVIIWYSPSGIGGSEPPFNTKNYESGRMYINIVQADGFVVSFDCKAHENYLDMLSLLNTLRNGKDKNMNLFDFLIEPFSTGLTSKEFFSLVSSLPQVSETMYVSKRYTDPCLNSLLSIIVGVQDELNSDYLKNEMEFMNLMKTKLNFHDPIGDKSMEAMEKTWGAYSWQEPWDPARDYLLRIHGAARKNGGVIVLYGCSATGFVDDPLGLGSGLPDIGRSLFDTQRRINDGNPLKTKEEKKVKVNCPFCGTEIDICEAKCANNSCGKSREEMFAEYQRKYGK